MSQQAEFVGSTAAKGPSPDKALRKLFLTLFLRGRGARGLQRQGAPKSVGQKLALTLAFYALFGLFSLVFLDKPVFGLSAYLHGMTFVFLGMFLAASAGDVLFNKEEADILMHRPVTPGALLWAKVGVLLQVSLWLSGALNLVGLIVGGVSSHGGWLFPVAHVISTAMEAFFCAGLVVLVYELCLRWFGRERLDGLMTTAQVVVSVAAVLGGQLMPRLTMAGVGKTTGSGGPPLWGVCLPPMWFAGFDDAIAGGGGRIAWILAGIACVATAGVLTLAFGRLSRDYESGLKALAEASPRKPKRGGGGRWIGALTRMVPFRWWLRDSVSRAAFVLSLAYLLRDRDVKLRVYPGVAPILALPLIFIFQGRGGAGQNAGGMPLAFCGMYLGMVPAMVLGMLKYSQHWQASDLFRMTPILGPGQLCHGARRAVIVLMLLPAAVVLVVVACFAASGLDQLMLLLPGLILLPVYAMVPCLGGNAVPLSHPVEEAKSAGRGLHMVAMMMVSGVFAGVGALAWSQGWFWWLVLGEAILTACVYAGMRASVSNSRWKPID